MKAVWNGTAGYFSLKVGGECNGNGAWYYADPKEAARQIKGRVAFWKGVHAIGRTSGLSIDEFPHLGNHDRPFSDRGGDAFDRPGAHVSHRENAGP